MKVLRMLQFGRMFAKTCALRSSGKIIGISTRLNSTFIQEKQFEDGLDSNKKEKLVNPSFVPQQKSENEKNNTLFSNVKENDVPSVLNIAVSSSVLPVAFQALNVLATWNKTKKISFKEQIEKDPNFAKFVSIVEKRADFLQVSEILNALRNLVELGVPNDNFLIECLLMALMKFVGKKYQLCVFLPFHQSLENDLLWYIRKVSVHSLLLILIFQSQHQETERQQRVVEATIKAIELRWAEVKFPGEFILVYENSQHFNANLLSHIDDRVIEASVDMALTDLSKVMCSLVTCKRRPTPVLRSLAFHMFKSNDKLSPKQIRNVLYTMNALSFPDEALLEKLSSDLLSQIDSIEQPTVIGGISYCLGQLRYKPKALLDEFGYWLLKNIESCRLTDLRSFILTSAIVSYAPNNVDDLIKACNDRFNIACTSEKTLWIDIIWSLVILGKASKESVASILDPSFVEGLPLNDPSNVGILLKLMNIKAAAETLFDNAVPKLNLPVDSLLYTQSREDLSLQVFVHKVLRNFLPPPKYLKTNVRTSMGFIVDAELVIDKNRKPLPVDDYSTNFGEVESSQPLPEGALRIALMVWNFKDFTIGTQEITGVNNLAVRLLRAKGYKVLEVPYFDVNSRDKTVKNVQYFEKRINQVFLS